MSAVCSATAGRPPVGRLRALLAALFGLDAEFQEQVPEPGDLPPQLPDLLITRGALPLRTRAVGSGNCGPAKTGGHGTMEARQ